MCIVRRDKQKKFISFGRCPYTDCVHNGAYHGYSPHCHKDSVRLSEDGICLDYADDFLVMVNALFDYYEKKHKDDDKVNIAILLDIENGTYRVTEYNG